MLTVHATGTVDVMHDADGSVDIFLSAAEHGCSNVELVEKKKTAAGTRGETQKKKEACSEDGCSNQIRKPKGSALRIF